MSNRANGVRWRPWPRFQLSTLLLIVACIAAALGWFTREAEFRRQRQVAMARAYCDQATLSTEALARLRLGDTAGAIAYLENRADRALHGVPNWRTFNDMSPAGRFALSQAKIYRRAFPTTDAAVNWYLRDVPPLPPAQMSASLKQLNARAAH